MRRVLAAVVAVLLLTAGGGYAADNSITTPDAGKKLDTHDVSTGAGTVHRQGVVICDPDTNLCAAVTSTGVKTHDRALSHTTDTVSIGDGVDILQVDSSGRITVVATGTVTANQGGTWTVQSAQSGSWTVAATQSGTWSVRLQDGAGNVINSLSTNPSGSEQGLIVRNIPSGTQAVSATALTDGTQQAIVRGAAKGGTSAANATVSSIDANTNGLDVFIRGGAGAGGTSMQDNTTFTGGSSAVTPLGALYDTTPPSVVDGNIGVPVMDSSRRLIVACPTCPGGTGGTALQDKAAFVEGSGSGTPAMGVFNDTISADPTEDQAAVIRMTAKRAMHFNPRNSAGVETGTSGTPLRVDPTGTTTQPVSIPGGVSVSGTVTANLGTLNSVVTEKAQGSTTSGQSGPLTQAAVTTSAPSYTTAQTSPLSLTTAGDLRTVNTTGLADRTASGNVAGAGQSVAISLQGLQGVSYAVTGTWVATLRCQVTSDGSTWVDVDSYNPGTESLQTDVVGNGQFACDLPGGMQQARVTANSYTSGTAAVALRANTVPHRAMHSYDRPAGQSLPNHAALIGGSDGTNIQNAGVFDVDSGGGTQYVLGASIRLSNSGGSVEGGTAANPIRVDPTGTTSQPVTISSGTATAVGPSASGAAASGNPVQTGAVFRTTQPTVSNGQIVENQATARGALIVATGVDAFAADTELNAAAALSDTTGNPTTAMVGAAKMVWDGTQWTRARQASNGFDATATGIPVGAIVGQFDDASPSTITENQFGVARATPNRAIHVNLRAQDGSELSVGGGTQYDEDTVHSSGDKLTMAGVVQKNTAAALAADGDRTALQVDGTGSLWINCRTGCASSGDTVGSTTTLNSGGGAGSTAVVALSGQQGAEFSLVSGTLAATLTPEYSTDGGTIYNAAVFVNNVTGVVSTSQAFTNPSPNFNATITFAGSATHVRVRVSSFTSGAADATLRAVAGSNLAVMMGTDGTNLRTHSVTSSGEAKVAYGSGTFATNMTQLAGGAIDVNSGTKSGGTLRVVLATDQPQLTNKLLVTPDANSAVNVAQINGVTPLMGAGNTGTGSQRVTIATDQATVSVNDNGSTSGGASTCYITSAASTNSTSCKGSAGQIYGISAVNTTATTYYLRLYNSSSAPTCSSATGFIRTIPVLATGGAVEMRQVGAAFGTGIGFCLTGGGSSTDNTNAATGVYITLEYK